MSDLIVTPHHPPAVPPTFINSFVSRSMQARLLWLPDDARSMGIHIMAGKGSGKSRLMGRVIAWLDFLRGIPLVIFDPHGPTIDNFLDKIVRQPKELQEQVWRRVIYVDMSGRTGRVIPFPLYYRLGQEGLYEISQRYLDVVRKLDPNLQTASVEGWNPLWRIGTSVGMVLAALGFQITEAENLVRDPSAWERYFARAVSTHPDVQPAVEFFQDYATWKDETQGRRSDSFLNKAALFAFDPAMKAMFGASIPGIDWNRVVHERSAVLLDFRHEQDIERRRFKMVWAFNYFLTFIKHRGAGRHRPVGLIIDELTSLFSVQTLSTDLFASDLDDLINVIARNYRVWLTITHQELFQLDERARKTLMAMGTQVLGVTSDRDAALDLAREFFRFNPYWVKKREPIYNSSHGVSNIIDYRTVEFTMDEQTLLRSYAVSDQGRFHFLVSAAPREGDTTGALRPVTLQNLDRDRYPDEQLVAQARTLLMERRAERVSDILAEIDARFASGDHMRLGIVAETMHQPKSDVFGRMNSDGYFSYDDNPAQFGEQKTAAQLTPSSGE